MKFKNKQNTFHTGPSNEKELFSSNEISPFTRGVFLRSLFLGALGLGLEKIGYSKNRSLFPELKKRSRYSSVSSPVSLKHYYGHDAVLDRYGVIAPWYRQPNGQCDFRIRIAAETLKRYPWTTTKNAVAAYPDYLFTSNWEIASDGKITTKHLGDWSNGDLGQRAISVLEGMVDYYRYSGDPAAIAHLTYMGTYLLDHCLTPKDHSWPGFPISVPTKGKAYGKADPGGMIQLDICGLMGEKILRAYQVTKNKRWFDAARHWGDLFAGKCNVTSGNPPWPRYANPENTPWKDNPRNNLQTGGVVMILSFLDELLRLGYSGENDQILKARDAGIRYLRDELLPEWSLDKTWGCNYWDWIHDMQECTITTYVANYLVKHKELFPNWRNDARNILTIFFNRTGADPKSGGDVYSGAWAYPESSMCCSRSLWYAPLLVGTAMLRYGVLAEDALMRELGYRQLILQTYDAHESGVTEDNIDGGVIVNNEWLAIAVPLPFMAVQHAIGWLPEELGASRENHLVRSSAVIDSIVYAKDTITYSSFDAPPETIDILRLSYLPNQVLADDEGLRLRDDLKENGYVVKKLPNGDVIVHIRHDGKKRIMVTGADPQTQVNNTAFQYEGAWTQEKDESSLSGTIYLTGTKDASVNTTFTGNQVRLTGRADQFGGRADVFIDGIKQSAFIDFWNPATRGQQILYYKNGLEAGSHTLTIRARGDSNPYAQGSRIYIDTIQFSPESVSYNFPSGTGPTGAQRMIFGYIKRQDYKDTRGNLWRPATEVITRLSAKEDPVARCWMSKTKHVIRGTSDPELYSYGYRARDFWVNLTVGPGIYKVRLMFAATPDGNQNKTGFDIIINEKTAVRSHKVVTISKNVGRAGDLVFKNIVPQNGIIQIRFKGLPFLKGNTAKSGEAFVQALELTGSS